MADKSGRKTPKAENYRRMTTGELFDPGDPVITAGQDAHMAPMEEYNLTRATEPERRRALAERAFASFGDGSTVLPPFHANWGGAHVHIGSGVFVNFNAVFVDDTDIFIGDRVMMGPNVTIATASHPVDPGPRRENAQYNLPVRIGDNVWLGAGVIVCPGVTIGADTVVGAGSVVTRDLPERVLAVGSPARVVRAVSAEDSQRFAGQWPVPG